MYNKFIENYEKYQDIVPDYENLLVLEWNNGLSPARKIGSFTRLWKQYGKPTDYKDFYNSYSTYYGLGQLEDSTKKLSSRTEVDLDICYGWVYYKFFIQSTRGARMEEKALQYINNSGNYTATATPYSIDTTDGIDMFIYKNDKLSYGIQIKPLSFFLKDFSIIEDRKILKDKLKNSEKKYGIKCYYMIYDRNEEWIKNGNYTVWDLNITDNEGNVKLCLQ